MAIPALMSSSLPIAVPRARLGAVFSCISFLHAARQVRGAMDSIVSPVLAVPQRAKAAGLTAGLLVAGSIGLGVPFPVLAGTFDCLIEPTQVVDLASPVTGLIDRILVKRGDRVAKGQTVALIESRAEQAAAALARFKSEQMGPIRMAENKIEFSKRKFDRRRQLANERLMAVQDSDDAEAEHRLAESELMVAQENRQIARIEFQQQNALLGLRTLHSPFDGVVADQLVHPGEVVEPGTGKKAVLKLAQLDPLRIHVIMPKDVFGRVAPGMSVNVSPEIPANGKYTAKVKTIDRLIDAASGTFVVFLEMPNPKLDVPAGVKCKAEFAGVDAVARRGSIQPKK